MSCMSSVLLGLAVGVWNRAPSMIDPLLGFVSAQTDLRGVFRSCMHCRPTSGFNRDTLAGEEL